VLTWFVKELPLRDRAYVEEGTGPAPDTLEVVEGAVSPGSR
jgi:hypothetical protein